MQSYEKRPLRDPYENLNHRAHASLDVRNLLTAAAPRGHGAGSYAAKIRRSGVAARNPKDLGPNDGLAGNWNGAAGRLCVPKAEARPRPGRTRTGASANFLITRVAAGLLGF